MKRSEINATIKEMEDMLRRCRVFLPPFCGYTPSEWANKGHEYDEVRDSMLGWDITDYGLDCYDRVGLALLTLRNGNVNMQKKYAKPYAEKLLYLKEGQHSPMHFHWRKMEDIINRGGGDLLIRVMNTAADEEPDKTGEVLIHLDGREMIVQAGMQVRLAPGESICISPYLYHDFEAAPGKGPALIGEISMCNDDENDNRFMEKVYRFPEIQEDEPPYRLLCTEYPRL